ncbi:acyl carrier protein [Desulfosporosinus fructosivorans]
MALRADITTKVLTETAKAFQKDVSELSLDTNLLNDLDAKSFNYFPIIAALEDEYDLEFQYQEFRRKCKTIGDIIDLVLAECGE